MQDDKLIYGTKEFMVPTVEERCIVQQNSHSNKAGACTKPLRFLESATGFVSMGIQAFLGVSGFSASRVAGIVQHGNLWPV